MGTVEHGGAKVGGLGGWEGERTRVRCVRVRVRVAYARVLTSYATTTTMVIVMVMIKDVWAEKCRLSQCPVLLYLHVEITPGPVIARWRFHWLSALSTKGLSTLDPSTPPSPPSCGSARDTNKGVSPIRAFPDGGRPVYSLFLTLTYDVRTLCVLFLIAYVP